MILNRKYYTKTTFFRAWWNLRQVQKLSGEKVFKLFKLHKTEWPNKLYFYSPRLKRTPRFTGNTEELSKWKDSKLCETLCPTNAIRVTQDAFFIDERGCIACGLCVELAPPGVLDVSTELKVNRPV
jgi:NAD-dependent dihydropyrimidine dehydrogenase PreA subunit